MGFAGASAVGRNSDKLVYVPPPKDDHDVKELYAGPNAPAQRKPRLVINAQVAANAIPHNPRDIVNRYLGPTFDMEYKEMRANPRPFSEGVSFEHVPDRFIYKVQGHARIPVDSLMTKPLVTRELIESIECVVKDQFDAKTGVFWTQAVLAYKTGLEFIFRDTADDQNGKSPQRSGLVPDTEFITQKEYAYASTHVPVLTTLRVRSPDPDKLIVVGVNSFVHRQGNATTWLPVVNLVDSHLERHARKAYCDYSFREICTEILNELSRGEYDPKEGLRRFLQNALAHIGAMEAMPELHEYKMMVLRNYRFSAESCLRQLEESDHFIHLLSCRPRTPLRGEEFYMEVQRELHRQFLEETEKNRPQVVQDPQLEARMASALHPRRFTAFIEKFFQDGMALTNSPLRFEKTAQKYVNLCMADINVPTVTQIYLTTLQNQTELEQDLRFIVWYKTFKTIDKANVPNRLRQVYNVIKQALSAKNAEKAKSINAITIQVLLRTTKIE